MIKGNGLHLIAFFSADENEVEPVPYCGERNNQTTEVLDGT